MDEAGLVTTTDRDAFQQSVRVGRLQKLRRLGLAEELRAGHWRLEEGLEDTLRRMGERSDIIKTMNREMAGQDNDPSPGASSIRQAGGPAATPIVGRGGGIGREQWREVVG